MMKCLRRKSGFTLIEILLVILIIGILVGVLMMRASNVSDDAKKKAVAADLKVLKAAVEIYHIQYGRYPDVSFGNFVIPTEILNANPRLIDEVPTDPYNNNGKGYGYFNDAIYQQPPNGDGIAKYYVIWSLGKGSAYGFCLVFNDAVLVPGFNYIWVSNCKTNNHGGHN